MLAPRPLLLLTTFLLAVGGVPAPASAQELVVMIEQAPKTLDPIQATDAYGVRISHQLIFETLVTLGDDLEIAPGVAASWARPSPLRLRLKLRPGNRFADGSSLDAADVAFTLDSLMAPETGSPYGPALREKIARVRALDPGLVELELRGPYAAILHDLIVPVRSRNAGAERPLLGSGPFRLLEQRPTEIVLGLNEAYAGPRPGVERILFKVVADENTRLLKLQKGDIDLAVNAVPIDKLALFEKAPLKERFAVLQAAGLSYQYLGFNLDDPILRDVRVRRAIAHAIDVDALIRFRQHGRSTRATGLLLPGNPFALNDAAPPAHDPALAAKLLDEAGFPLKDGKRFTLGYKTSTDRAAVIQARAIQSDLKRVGIDVKVRAFEWGTFYEDIQNGNFQLFSLRWVGVSDPDFYYELFHSSRLPPAGRNRVRYRNAEMDHLLEQGLITSDPAKRRAIYLDVQRILARDLPYLSLWHNANVAVVSRRLKGYRLHPTGGFQHLAEVRKE